jgi:hypothetical protein
MNRRRRTRKFQQEEYKKTRHGTLRNEIRAILPNCLRPIVSGASFAQSDSIPVTSFKGGSNSTNYPITCGFFCQRTWSVVQNLFPCPLFIGYGIAGSRGTSLISCTSRHCRIAPSRFGLENPRPHARRSHPLIMNRSKQAFLKNQTAARKVVRSELGLSTADTDSKRYSEEVFRAENEFRTFTRHASG